MVAPFRWQNDPAAYPLDAENMTRATEEGGQYNILRNASFRQWLGGGGPSGLAAAPDYWNALEPQLGVIVVPVVKDATNRKAGRYGLKATIPTGIVTQASGHHWICEQKVRNWHGEFDSVTYTVGVWVKILGTATGNEVVGLALSGTGNQKVHTVSAGADNWELLEVTGTFDLGLSDPKIWLWGDSGAAQYDVAFSAPYMVRGNAAGIWTPGPYDRMIEASYWRENNGTLHEISGLTFIGGEWSYVPGTAEDPLAVPIDLSSLSLQAAMTGGIGTGLLNMGWAFLRDDNSDADTATVQQAKFRNWTWNSTTEIATLFFLRSSGSSFTSGNTYRGSFGLYFTSRRGLDSASGFLP